MECEICPRYNRLFDVALRGQAVRVRLQSVSLWVRFYSACSLATRKLSVRPSIRLSVKRVICDKTEESCAHILIPNEISFILVL